VQQRSLSFPFVQTSQLLFTEPSDKKFQQSLETQSSGKRFTYLDAYLHDGGLMIWLLLLTALVAGMLLPVQVGINAELRNFVGHPILAATVQFVVGALALIAIFIAMGISLPHIGKVSAAPWWVWLGGLCGANYIVVAILVGPRLGASTLTAVTVTGQILVSLILDHIGAIGFPLHPVSGWRILGAGFLVAGLALIHRF
jgi:bacterial/archaeal transporter family-2 protein